MTRPTICRWTIQQAQTPAAPSKYPPPPPIKQLGQVTKKPRPWPTPKSHSSCSKLAASTTSMLTCSKLSNSSSRSQEEPLNRQSSIYNLISNPCRRSSEPSSPTTFQQRPKKRKISSSQWWAPPQRGIMSNRCKNSSSLYRAMMHRREATIWSTRRRAEYPWTRISRSMPISTRAWIWLTRSTLSIRAISNSYNYSNNSLRSRRAGLTSIYKISCKSKTFSRLRKTVPTMPRDRYRSKSYPTRSIWASIWPTNLLRRIQASENNSQITWVVKELIWCPLLGRSRWPRRLDRASSSDQHR